MNQARRRQLSAIARKLQSLKEQAGALATELESVRDDEQEAYDNLPESVQDGDRGDAMQDAITNIEEAISAAESGDLPAAVEALEAIEGVTSTAA
jgi:predicted  nucleic acid-binding Zn-ribbon protein